MWFHKHPYPPFIPETATRLIVGTLPPPRFSTGNLNAQDVDFCYGSSNGMLWKIWNRLYDLKLDFENTHFAIEQRKAFLKHERFGICDIVGEHIAIKLMHLTWECKMFSFEISFPFWSNTPKLIP